MTFIGEDRVIVVRDNDGLPQVLVNSCRHRGNAVCRAEEGHATSFMCTYHGWTYDLKGALVGVPGFKEVYHEELDRENWGLIKAAQVETYKGFIFANMDPAAPSFQEYLGDVGRMCISMVAEKGEDVIACAGVQKYTMPANWKFAADNVWDFYHGGISHASSFMSGWQRNDPRLRNGRPQTNLNVPNMAFLGEYGHVFGGPQNVEQNVTRVMQFQDWRERPQAKEAFGPLIDRIPNGHPQIFPNFWVTGPGMAQVSLRLPKGPMTTEIWWFTFLDKTTPDRHKEQVHRAVHTFGPAGMLEQDDGDNWGQSTSGTKGLVARRYPLNYSMGNLHDKVIRDELSPPRVESESTSEHPQLWHYRAWSEWMAARDWNELREIHSRIPDRV
jgi:3-phenylpropionate/trans-cinnamate dioxygenase alpha subunit